MPREQNRKEGEKTEITAGGLRDDGPGKSGRGMETNNKRYRQLENVNRTRSERKARKDIRLCVILVDVSVVIQVMEFFKYHVNYGIEP